MSIKLLEKAIKQELVAEMQTNPWLIAADQTGLGINHVKTRSLALELSSKHIADLRRSAFIFGDTYENQPIEKSKKLMETEGFEFFSDDNEGNLLYLHASLGITASLKHDYKNELVSITLLCDMLINELFLTPTSLTGLGAVGEIIDSRFNCSVDATCGLFAKMYVLRHLATDGSVA